MLLNRQNVTHSFVLAIFISMLFLLPCELLAYKYQIGDYMKDAENGDSIAQFYVGWAYLNGGHGANANIAFARYWLNKSAEQNDADALCALGESYLQEAWNTAKEHITLSKKENKIYCALYDEAEKYLLPAARKGQPWSYYLLYHLYRGGDKQDDVKYTAFLRLFKRRMGYVPNSYAEATYDKIMKSLPPLKKEFSIKAINEMKRMAREFPIMVPKRSFIKAPLSRPYMTKNEIEKNLKDVVVKLKEVFPGMVVQMPIIKVVSRSEFLNNILNKSKDTERTNIKDIVVKSISTMGDITADLSEMLIITRNVITVMKQGDIAEDKFKNYFKLYLASLLAKKWFLIKCANRQSSVSSSLSEGFSMFIANRMCKEFDCKQSNINAGLFYSIKLDSNYGHTEFYEDRIVPPLRFFNYLSASFGKDSVWKIFNNLPNNMEEIIFPENYSAKFIEKSKNIKKTMAIAITSFKNKDFTQAKYSLQKILAVKPKYGHARFMLAVINAKQKDFASAWLNISIAKKNMPISAKMKTFVKQLKNVAPEYELIW